MAWFNLKDSYITVQRATAIATPQGMSAVPSGPWIRILSATKATFDPGGKAASIKGSGIIPIATSIGTAEPKLDVECSNAFEVATTCKAIGGVGSLCIVAINFVRNAMTPVGYLFLPCTWMNGGGFDLDDAKGASDKIALLPQDVLRDGVSIYNKLA